MHGTLPRRCQAAASCSADSTTCWPLAVITHARRLDDPGATADRNPGRREVIDRDHWCPFTGRDPLTIEKGLFDEAILRDRDGVGAGVYRTMCGQRTEDISRNAASNLR